MCSLNIRKKEQIFVKLIIIVFTKGLFLWGELARLRGLAPQGEVIFILRSYEIFYLTAKSLLRHRKKIVLITWLLSGKFYIFNIDSRRLQQYYEYDHCFFYSFATSWDFTYISFTFIRFYLSGSTRGSHFQIEFGKIPKIPMHFKEKSSPLCQAGLTSHVHMTNFHLT